ncbi:MAG: hypothetical protein JSW58_04765 [Candidatus Latescibacterota bacterium]|nr:MAG: hypothetical protein JSW58_04765 [Candidatus Latescibacterota bacterium]
MRVTGSISIILVTLILLGGCESESGIGTRYAVEKKMWDARVLEQKISADVFTGDYRDVDAAIDAYEEILASTHRDSVAGQRWSPRIRIEIQRLTLMCKIALTKLYFSRFEENAAVTYYRSGYRLHDVMFDDIPDISLALVRSLYDSLPEDSVGIRCGTLLKDVVEDHILWFGDIQIGDTLLDVPLYLARTQMERGNKAVDPDFLDLAETFYSRIVHTWPDSLLGYKARISRAKLYTLSHRFDDALDDVENAMGSEHVGGTLDELKLFKGELLGHGLKRYDDAKAVFDDLVSHSKREFVVHMAKLNLASVEMAKGNRAKGTELFREIELSNDVAPKTVAKAMFLRALDYQRNGNWAEALNRYWRICRLYPFTPAAAVAPLVIVRHYDKTGDVASRERALGKATEYYLGAIGKDSKHLDNRHVLKDYLIETYLICENPIGAARELSDGADKWRAANGSMALIKSAMIYLNLLDDEENGVRMLKKCLDAFPETRYSRVALRELNRISPNNR